MPPRTIPDKMQTWLLDELEVWRAQGLLAAEQVQLILDLYETSDEAAERKQSWAMLTLLSLAALLVGLAALLLVGYNWQGLSREVKLFALGVSVVGTHGVGFYLRYRRGARLLSEIAFLLGCLFYGVGIWQVAQIFHIQSHYPNGIWIWALGCLPFALCLETPLLHVLVTGLLALWVGTEILGFHTADHSFFWNWGVLRGLALSLPLLAAPGLLWAYRRRSAATVGLYASLLCWWVVLQPVTWHHEQMIVYFIGGCGALFLLLGGLHREGDPLARPYQVCGALLTGGTLAMLSFHDFNREVIFHFLRETTLTGFLLTSIFNVLLLAGTLVLVGWRHPNGQTLGTFVRNHWLPVGVAAGMALLPMLNAMADPKLPSDAAILMGTMVGNLGMLGLAFWLIRNGLVHDRGLTFTTGIVYFLLWTIFRYVDLFARLGGMLGAAFMFLFCGLTLFAVAFYWRHRKESSHV